MDIERQNEAAQTTLVSVGGEVKPSRPPSNLERIKNGSGVRGSDLNRHVLKGQRVPNALSPRLPISPPRAKVREHIAFH